MRRFLLVCSFLCPLAFAQTALTRDQIVDRYIAARGGRDAINAITSLSYSADFGNGHIRKMFKMRPYYFLVGCTEPTCAYAEGFDGSAWEGSAKRNRLIRARLEAAKSLRRVSEFDDPLIGWREKGHKLELRGVEQFNGRKAYRLDITLNDGLSGSDYIDAETFLIIGTRGHVPMHSRGEHFATVNYYEDYRPVNGVLYPFRIRTVDAKTGKTVSGEKGWDKIEANLISDQAFFAPPVVHPEPFTSLVEYLLSVSGSITPSEQWFAPYAAFRNNPANAAVDTENDLNWLGYELLKQDSLSDALLVFQTIVKEHPDSSNAYDSLGDALAQGGRTREAIAAFAKVVQLDPKASAAQEKLESLRKTGKVPPQY